MSLDDRYGNPIKLNRLYVDWNDVKEANTSSFPMNYTSGLCKVINLDSSKPYLRVQDEISGSREGGEGGHAIALGKRLIPLNKEEVAELIKDRERRLSLLESCKQNQLLCTDVKDSKWSIPGSPFEQ